MTSLSYNALLNYKKRFLFFTILVGITLPFPVRFNSIAIILLFINWLTVPNLWEMIKQLRANKFALILMAFYLYHILQVFNTSHIQDAFFDLEKKIAFLILPIIFATAPFIDRVFVDKVLQYFSWSCLAASLICLVNAIYSYEITGDSNYLFYHQLGAPINFHAVYFSLYISTATFIQLQYLIDRWKTISATMRIITISVILFFMGFLLLLSSKTIIISFFILIIFLMARIIFQSKGKIIGWVGSASLGFIFFIFVALIPNVRDRFEEILFDEYQQENPLLLNDYQGYHFTGANIRLAIWKICLEMVNIKKAWIIGVGPGDAQSELTQAYEERHIYPGDGVNEGFLYYNAHNQFLQYYVSLGIIGLVFFLGIFGILMGKIYRSKKIIAGCIFVIFFSFCLTESVLERQKGIVFFSLFAVLLLVENERKEVSSNNCRS